MSAIFDTVFHTHDDGCEDLDGVVRCTRTTWPKELAEAIMLTAISKKSVASVDDETLNATFAATSRLWWNSESGSATEETLDKVDDILRHEIAKRETEAEKEDSDDGCR